MSLSLDQLTEKTTLDDTDILHLRQIDRIDKKILPANLALALGVVSFPVGTMLMFDGNNAGGGGDPTGVSGPWVDDETMPGWYACIDGNSDHGCPDMVNKFIMGKVIAGAAATGGSNNLLDHLHASSIQSASHIHTLGNQSASHTHTTTIGSHSHTDAIRSSTVGNQWRRLSNSYSDQVGKVTSPIIFDSYTGYSVAQNTNRTLMNSFNYGDKVSGNQSASHIHTAGNQSANHNHTIGSGDVPSATDIRPSFYSIIYIRKCA